MNFIYETDQVVCLRQEMIFVERYYGSAIRMQTDKVPQEVGTRPPHHAEYEEHPFRRMPEA